MNTTVAPLDGGPDKASALAIDVPGINKHYGPECAQKAIDSLNGFDVSSVSASESSDGSAMSKLVVRHALKSSELQRVGGPESVHGALPRYHSQPSAQRSPRRLLRREMFLRRRHGRTQPVFRFKASPHARSAAPSIAEAY